MTDHLLRAYVWQRTLRMSLARRLEQLGSDESGEGVISAAIAVLVMAFLGVLMWQLFKGTLTDANDNVNNQINQIGR
jgi:hypothetical protein